MSGAEFQAASGESAASRRRGKRRFPPPWSVKDHKDACFIVKDGGAEQLGNRARVHTSWLLDGRSTFI
jgi:hypothetical protein